MDWETFAERLTDAQARLHDLCLRYPDVQQADSHHDRTDGADKLLGALRDLETTFDEFATAQDKLRLQMDQLEARVAERTRELEAASRAKDDFLASLSHELRTPVNVIRGFARMLRDGSLDAESRERAIEAIDRNAARQTRLVADLLDVARINAGRFAIRRTHMDLRTAVVAAREAAQGFGESRQIEMALRLPEAPAWIWGDATCLQQAFNKLLSNAIKFSPAGSRVEVELVAEGSDWRVSVCDRGSGIAPEFMPHLFERFRQADSGTSIHGGLGLGLSIVQHIIEGHGGTVSAYSGGRGSGAIFSCILPSLSAPQTGDPPGEPPVS
jgi:signal transduction histidine kinase